MLCISHNKYKIIFLFERSFYTRKFACKFAIRVFSSLKTLTTRARGFAELLLLHAASSFGLLLLRRVLVGTIGCIWLRLS